MKKCVYAGTFDPPTTGHENVISQALLIFDEVVVAVMINPGKTPLLSVDERLNLLDQMYGGEKQVKIVAFDGAVVDILEMEGTPFYVRGVRNTVDFEYETADYYASKRLKPDLVAIYIPSDQEELHVSSTLVKNSHKFNKDYTEYIPKKIKSSLMRLLESKNV